MSIIQDIGRYQLVDQGPAYDGALKFSMVCVCEFDSAGKQARPLNNGRPLRTLYIMGYESCAFRTEGEVMQLLQYPNFTKLVMEPMASVYGNAGYTIRRFQVPVGSGRIQAEPVSPAQKNSSMESVQSANVDVYGGRKFDVVLLERPDGEGIQADEYLAIHELIKEGPSRQYLPETIDNPGGGSYAIGLATLEADQILWDSAAEFLGMVLADMELESPDGTYKTAGLDILMTRNLVLEP